jgi:hypothetical protein
MLHAYAFPAANGDRVGKNEVAYQGCPFIRSIYSLTKEGDGDFDPYASFTRLSTPLREIRKELPCGWAAERLYFLGMASSCSTGSGGWYVQTMDHAQDFFLGDSIGEITVCYADTDEVRIPLIVGFTAWWGSCWQPGHQPFCAEGPARQALRESLFLHDVFDTSLGCYVLAFDPRPGVPIERIVVRNNPAKAGWPTLHGITVLNPSGTAGLVPFYRHPEAAPVAMKALTEEILADEAGIRGRLERLQRHLYTFEDDLPDPAVEMPRGFQGPKIQFRGNRFAAMLTNEYLNCLGTSVLAGDLFSVADNGGYSGVGTWDLSGPAGGPTWTRDLARVLIERTRAGRGEWVEKSIEAYDRLMYGVENHRTAPRAHWVQDYLFDQSSAVHLDGQCHYPRSTRTGEVVVGNLENDGHGLLMLMRYRWWVQSGRNPEWLQRTWQATSDAAEWVCWQLDNPFDVASMAVESPDEWMHCFREPERQHFPDCLWSESESSYYGACEIWTDFACYAGLLASIAMANARGDGEVAARWTAYGERLKKGMLAHLVVESPTYGKTWRYLPACLWRDYNHALAPVIDMADILGLDISGMDREMLEISRNTYAERIRRGPGGSKYYTFVRAFGYGQAFITEAALLLDEMEDATRLIEAIARYMYSPFHLPWVCSEGVAVHETGRYWYRTGGVGNEVQIASAVRVMRMIAGIDDYNPPAFRFIPRLPLGWESVTAEDVPVPGTLLRMSYRRPGPRKYVLEMASEKPLETVEARLGPFSPGATKAKMRVHSGGRPVAFELAASGDSAWAWVRGLRDVKEMRLEGSEE